MRQFYYLTSYDLRKQTGKERATTQKLSALRSLKPNLIVYFPRIKNRVLRLLLSQLLDFALAIGILFKFRSHPILICRGETGFISAVACAIRGGVSVREVHAMPLEEFQLNRRSNEALLTRAVFYYSDLVDKYCDIRWFNHPQLLSFYQENYKAGKYDFFTYNGASRGARSHMPQCDCRRKFGFSATNKYLVFIGSASAWHGVDYLVDLQAELDRREEPIKIVVGGGDISALPGSKTLINISPLSSEQCADLINAADGCLLPVKANRVSPGSPLKLYDYMLHKKFIFAQECTLGYSDEVERYGVGVGVDFAQAGRACEKILEVIAEQGNIDSTPRDDSFYWENRMAFVVSRILRD